MKILLVRPILLNPLTITKAIDCEPLEWSICILCAVSSLFRYKYTMLLQKSGGLPRYCESTALTWWRLPDILPRRRQCENIAAS